MSTPIRQRMDGSAGKMISKSKMPSLSCNRQLVVMLDRWSASRPCQSPLVTNSLLMFISQAFNPICVSHGLHAAFRVREKFDEPHGLFVASAGSLDQSSPDTKIGRNNLGVGPLITHLCN
jgi:hypothetical protein